jgi:hypothetical protein
LEIETLAKFDSLGRSIFMLGKMRLNRNEFFRSTNFGPHGIIAQFVNRQDFQADCEIDLSPEAFDLVMTHLNNKEHILIRIGGHHVGTSGNVVANQYSILTAVSDAPNIFCKEYIEYYTKADDEERKKLKFVNQRFIQSVRSKHQET